MTTPEVATGVSDTAASAPPTSFVKPRIAVVLGGGWKLGASFHAGVLLASVMSVDEVPERHDDGDVGSRDRQCPAVDRSASVRPRSDDRRPQYESAFKAPGNAASLLGPLALPDALT